MSDLDISKNNFNYMCLKMLYAFEPYRSDPLFYQSGFLADYLSHSSCKKINFSHFKTIVLTYLQVELKEYYIRIHTHTQMLHKIKVKI